MTDHIHRKPAARGGALMTTPWLRAPLLLLRQPVVFLAIVGAAGILAIAAASGPLFLSTIGTASLHAQAQQRCPESAQPTVTAAVDGGQLAFAAKQGVQSFARNGLPAAYYASDGFTHVGATLVHVFSRKGALDHVTKLTRDTGAAGIWLPNAFAAKIGAKAGDTVTTVSGKPMHVAGIYRDLAPDPFALSHLSRYWCSYSNQIVSTVASDQAIAATAPQFRQGPWIIADQATVGRVSEDAVQMTWSAPMSTVTNPLSTFDSALPRTRAAIEDLTGVSAEQDTGLPQLTTIAHAARRGVSGSIVPIEVAGVIVAGLLVGGAGMFWASARQREIRLLVARGVGPFALAGKAVLETAVPAVIGAVGGFFGTSALVKGVGPAQALEADAPLHAGLLVAGTLLLGLALIGVIGGLAGRDRTIGRQVSWARLVPWELALLALAIVLAMQNRHNSAVSIDHTVVRISALVVLYPLLGATAALLLIGRIIGSMLPNVGASAAQRGTTTPYLTLRRISRSRAVVIGLIIGTALPCCLLMYGSTVTNTVSTEVTSKYETNLGAPHVLQIYGVKGALMDPENRGTQVVIYRTSVSLGEETPAYVLGVDPKTFDDFAFVDSTQRSAVQELGPNRDDGALPAIIVHAAGVGETDRLHIGQTTFQLQSVASLNVFPGLRNSAFPMVVVDQRALGHVDDNVERLNQFWTSDDQYGKARRLIQSDHYTVLFELTSQVVVGTTGLLPVTWLFGYLRALAILIGVVAIAGLVFGLAARTRRRRVSYVLSRRMGMSKTVHLASLLMELTLVIGLGWLAGSGLGVGSFGFVYKAFDVYPDLAPGARFAIPSLPVVLTAAISATVVLLASLATHWLAERTRPAEILRLE